MSKDIINGGYSFEYLPTQKKTLNTCASLDYSDILYSGGFGSGKTRFICEASMEFLVTYPNIKIGIFRKNRVNVEATTYEVFKDRTCPDEYIRQHDKSKLRFILVNGSKINFYGIDRFLKRGSLEFDIIFVDEGIELDEDDNMMLEGRLRGHVLKRPFICWVTNPGMPKHFLHEKFIENKTKNKRIKYFSISSFENIHNPPAYFERLKRWEGTRYYNRYVLGMWEAFEGLVYDMFKPKRQIIDPFIIPDSWAKRIWIDFGYDNPLSIGWVATDPIYNVDYIYRQFYHTKRLLRKAIPQCKKITEEAGENIIEIIADHDAEGRAQVEEDWMEVTPAQKDVKSGIQAVAESLLFDKRTGGYGVYIFNNAWSDVKGYKYGLIKFDPLLVEQKKPICFQDEIQSYEWGKNDEPCKENDHAMDGYRYLRYTREYKNLINKRTGVITHDAASRR